MLIWLVSLRSERGRAGVLGVLKSGREMEGVLRSESEGVLRSGSEREKEESQSQSILGEYLGDHLFSMIFFS